MWQHFGRMLQIAVHGDQGAPACGAQPRQKRMLMSEVPRKPKTAHARAGGRGGTDRSPGAIAASVVDHDELVRDSHRLEDREYAVHQESDVLLLVERWDDNRQLHPPRRWRPMT